MAEKKIQSGIGDGQDLFVKKPNNEFVEEPFQYRHRLAGKRKNHKMIYPELPFEYGIQYKGKVLEDYNEKPYAFNVNAHPKRCISYDVEETKLLPVDRLWEAEALFEAEVERKVLKYALQYSGSTGVEDKRTAEYKVCWDAMAVKSNHGDLKDLMTTAAGTAVGAAGYGNWAKSGSNIRDVTNVSSISGVIAKNKNMKSAEVTFGFKPILALNDSGNSGSAKRKSGTGFTAAAGWDDDVVGFIFKAIDKKNFYCMLWESDERIWMSNRAPNNLNALDVESSSDTFVTRAIAEGALLPGSPTPTNAQWEDYKKNKGWGQQHRRIYRVKDGKFKRIDVTPSGRTGGTNGDNASCFDKGTGRGWIMNSNHEVKVEMVGTRVKIHVKEAGASAFSSIYDFSVDTTYANGSFGVMNVSQAVEFSKVVVVEKEGISGCIPESGWSTSTDDSKTLATNATTFVKDSKSFKDAVAAAGISGGTVSITGIDGSTKTAQNGSITVNGLTGSIVVKSKDYTTIQDHAGRIPANANEWFEWDGIGDKVHAPDVSQMIKQFTGKNDLDITAATGIVQNPDAGTAVVAGLTGSFVARNNNPVDAGEIKKDRFYKCGIVTITPDNKNAETCKLIFDDIATVFAADHAKFFSRPDFINKKETYNLLNPVQGSKPPAEEDEVTEGGCVVPKAPKDEVVEEVIQCLEDFHFDGKKLCMWSCEFPKVITKKNFSDCVFAYQGFVSFDPLKVFTPNQWTTYELMPIGATVYDEYDVIEWVGGLPLKGAPVNSKIRIKTTEWYVSVFPADIINKGIIDTDKKLEAKMPPAPEHYKHPTRDEIMPNTFDEVDFLLDAWNNHADVVIWWKENPNITTENVSRSPFAIVGKANMPILKVSTTSAKESAQHIIVISCKPDPKQVDWVSGKYIGHGVVNGKRPYFSGERGKNDLTGIPTGKVFMPANLIESTLEGPFIDVKDIQEPLKNRIQYTLHSSKKHIDFYSDHQGPFEWETDWTGSWHENDKEQFATNKEIRSIGLLTLPDNVDANFESGITIVEKIEMESNNPFVEVYTDKLTEQFLIDLNGATEPIDLFAPDTKWVEFSDGADRGNWESVLHDGISKIINKANQNSRSGFYNEDFIQAKDYTISMFVQEIKSGDDDMYGIFFRYDVNTGNFYSFEIDAYLSRGGVGGTGVNGMAIYKNVKRANGTYQKTRLAHLAEGWGFGLNEVHQLKVTVIGNVIKAYMDNELKLTVTDTTAPSMLEGSWGPITCSQPKTYFWNLTSYKEKAAPQIYAVLKSNFPLPWHPLVHNGYYYQEDKEHYLFAKKIEHTTSEKELQVEPRPQQGAPVLIQDNKMNHLRKVTFYDDDLKQSFIRTDKFHGNGSAKYYLSYEGIQSSTIEVILNNKTVSKTDYMYHPSIGAIEFMFLLQEADYVEVKYELEKSFYVEMNDNTTNAYVNKDTARIHLQDKLFSGDVTSVQIEYEGAIDTPYYQATEATLNPINNNFHNGFLFIDDGIQKASFLRVEISQDYLEMNRRDEVLLTAYVLDEVGNPIEQEKVFFYRDGVFLGSKITNTAGEAYLTDIPTVTSTLTTHYEIKSNDLVKEVTLNQTKPAEYARHYIQLASTTRKLFAGSDEEAILTVTLLNDKWNKVGAGHSIKLSYVSTDGRPVSKSLTTDANSQVSWIVSAADEKNGELLIRASYDMGFEDALSYMYIEIIGG